LQKFFEKVTYFTGETISELLGLSERQIHQPSKDEVEKLIKDLKDFNLEKSSLNKMVGESGVHIFYVLHKNR